MLLTLGWGLQGSESEEVHGLPWFGAIQGFALVPPEGALTPTAAPAAIIVLTEGGQLMVTPGPRLSLGRCWFCTRVSSCLDGGHVVYEEGLCP